MRSMRGPGSTRATVRVWVGAAGKVVVKQISVADSTVCWNNLQRGPWEMEKRQKKEVVVAAVEPAWNNTGVGLTLTLTLALALTIDLREGMHTGVKWIVVPLCVEVVARGAINDQSWNWMWKHLGFSKFSKRRLPHGVQDAALACS